MRSTSRLALVMTMAVSLLTGCSANKIVVNRDALEYDFDRPGVHDAFLHQVARDLAQNEFSLRIESGAVPAGCDSLFSFVHVSDVQLRDVGVLYEGEIQSWLNDEIDQAALAGERVIVAGHHPLSNESGERILGGAEPDDMYLLDYLRSQPTVVAYLGGHAHRVYINLHESPSGTLPEIIAPSLHEFPQIALLITLFNSGSDLAMRIGPTRGDVTNGPLAQRLSSAREGAKKEADTTEECWKSGSAVVRFMRLR